MRPRHPGVGEPPRLRQLVRPLPATVPAQGVADAGRAAAVAGRALALLLAADAAIAARRTARLQLSSQKCCAN